MARSDYMVLSRPCKIFFAGWESTTTRLQQAGWNLAVEYNHREEVSLALRFDPGRIYMLTGPSDNCWWDERVGPTFQVRHIAADFICNIEYFSAFEPFDAKPQMIQRGSIKEHKIFAPVLARTEEIIVEPSTVAELMDKIRKLQAPELKAIRDRNRRDEPIQQQVFHAQILSFAG